MWTESNIQEVPDTFPLVDDNNVFQVDSHIFLKQSKIKTLKSDAPHNKGCLSNNFKMKTDADFSKPEI